MAQTKTTEYLSEKKALEYLANLGIPMSRVTLIQIRNRGSLSYSKVGGRIFYRSDGLRSLINQKKKNGVTNYAN